MAKEKKFTRITDLAAGVIYKHDNLQMRFDNRMKKIWNGITGAAASVITGHDYVQALIDRKRLIARYNFANFVHRNVKVFSRNRKSIIGHSAIFILVAIGLIATFNHATGYQYSYNGRAIGYVKNQEDVIKILDLVSYELTEEHGSNIQIDAKDDISFKRVVVVDKDVDNVDVVLKRLTYLSDMEAEAYGIYINNELYTICESENAVKSVLDTIKEEYMQGEEGKDIEYESVNFKEDVQINPVDTKLPYINSVNKAVNKIENGESEETTYKVKSGDTFDEICSDNNISFDELKEMNPDIEENKLHSGEELTISKASSALTVLTVERATYAEKVKYKTIYKKDSSMYEGDSKVIQEGENGKHVVTARIKRENGKIVSKEVLRSRTIKKTVTEIVVKGTKEVPKTAPTGNFIIPVSGYTLTSNFGYRWGRLHQGIDLACPTGTTIRASDGGTVVYAGWFSGYGMFIEIDHGNGIHTRYGHCSAINVSSGEKVYQGQKIGEVGNTGNSYGSHCHFEITVNGTAVDPFNYL